MRDPPSRRVGDNFYTYSHGKSAKHHDTLNEERRVKAEVEDERLRASLALRPEELRQEPVKRANKRALRALGFDGISLTQRRSSVLSRTSSGLSRAGCKGSSSRASSKSRHDASSKGGNSEESSSDSEDVEDLDSSAGLTQASSSSFARTQSSLSRALGSLQQECSMPSDAPFVRGRSAADHFQLLQVQMVGDDDADEGGAQQRARPIRTSPSVPSSSLSMQGMLTRLSRRFSSTELDMAAQTAGRAQSCSNVSLEGSSLGPDLSGCLSSRADKHALLSKQLTRQASTGFGDEGAVPGMSPTPFDRTS